MRDILMELKKQSEKAASIHQDLSQNLSDQAQRIQQIKDKHQSLCKQVESTVKTCQSSKKDLYNKTKSVSAVCCCRGPMRSASQILQPQEGWAPIPN